MISTGFFALGESDPSKVVLIEPSGNRVSAGELLAGMNRTARGLRALGLAAGDTVAVVMSNRREFIECYGAAIQAGMLLVAINWHLGPSEISYILDDSNARVVITEGLFADVVARTGVEGDRNRPPLFVVDAAEGFSSLSDLQSGQFAEAPSDRSPGQIMFYTSGTTGRPKGVHKAFGADPSDQLTLTTGIGPIGRLNSATEGSDLVYIGSGPLYHGLHIAGVANALDSGGMVVLMDKWTPEQFLSLVEQFRVTHATLVPTMFHRILAVPEEVRDRTDVSSLRAVSHGGAPCPVEIKRRMIEWWGPIITEAYSSTEGAGTFVTSEEWLRKPGTVGRPSPGVEIKILDAGGRECGPGEQGLVYVTPLLWEFEYRGDEEKTRGARHGNMFTVGDIGYLDEDGYLFLCDRQADTIIAGGVNIYPAEIEAVLLQHPAVRDAAVIGAPNEEWGEEVRAVVEVADQSRASPALAGELIQFCQDKLARFKCPRAVDFVDSLERDPNGKLRKGAIRAKYWPEGTRRI